MLAQYAEAGVGAPPVEPTDDLAREARARALALAGRPEHRAIGRGERLVHEPVTIVVQSVADFGRCGVEVGPVRRDRRQLGCRQGALMVVCRWVAGAEAQYAVGVNIHLSE